MMNRRPLASRSSAIAIRLAERLSRGSVTPDQISASGIVAAALAAAAFLAAPDHPVAWLSAAVLVQLRLVANLLDGMVAVEGGRGSALGPLWNEAPDRLEDTLILAGFGYAANAPVLGLWAVITALLCAYVRVLGGAFGQPQTFIGPMAKQHRMAAITLGCVLGFGASILGTGARLPEIILWGIVAGAILTCVRRLGVIAANLRGL